MKTVTYIPNGWIQRRKNNDGSVTEYEYQWKNNTLCLKEIRNPESVNQE